MTAKRLFSLFLAVFMCCSSVSMPINAEETESGGEEITESENEINTEQTETVSDHYVDDNYEETADTLQNVDDSKESSLSDTSELLNVDNNSADLIYDENYDANARLIPSIGNANSICFLVEFSDCPNQWSISSETISDRLNYYLHDSYQEISFGKLNLSVDVCDEWYVAEHPRSYYSDLAEEVSETYAREVLLNEIVRAYDDQIDFSQYDLTGDNYIDEMYIICSGIAGNSNSLWWPCGNDSNYIIEADGVRTGKFIWLDQRNDFDSVARHETGHSLGLVDLYDVQVPGRESFSVSDIMNDNTGNFNAYSKILLGWIDPVKISDASSVELRDSGSYPDAAIVYPYNDEVSDHFFVLEYAGPAQSEKGTVSFNDSTKNGGLRIWRVNCNPYSNNTNDKRIPYIENVDWQNYRGKVMIDRGQDYYTSMWTGDSDFTPYNYPSSYFYTSDEFSVLSGFDFSGISITDISPDGEILTCSVSYEEKPSQNEFSYELNYVLDNMLFGSLTFPVETFLLNDNLCLKTDNNVIIPLEWTLESDPANQRFTKLHFYADLQNYDSKKYYLNIPQGVLRNSYGAYNSEINIELINENKPEILSLIDINEKYTGISEFVTLNNQIYTFKLIGNYINLLQLSDDGDIVQSIPLINMSNSSPFLNASIYNYESIILTVQDAGTITVYRVSETGDLSIICSYSSDVSDSHLYSSGEFIALRKTDTAHVADICSIDLDTGEIKTVVPMGINFIGEALFSSNRYLFVLKQLDNTVKVYSIDGNLINSITLDNRYGFYPNESIGSFVDYGNNIGIFSSRINKNANTSFYFTVIDGSGNLVSRKELFSSVNTSGISKVYELGNGYFVCTNTNQSYKYPSMGGRITGYATGRILDSNLNYCTSVQFDKPEAYESICGICEIGTDEYMAYTEFQSMHFEFGHKYAEPTYTWSEDNSSVTASAVWEDDSSHVITETVSTTSTINPASCETSGSIVYTAEFTNKLFSDQTKTVEIPALGHKYGEPTYEWATDNTSVTATAVCEHDESHVVIETVKTRVETTEPTCEEAGEKTYTASFENELFETQTKTEVMEALGHDWSEWIVVKEPTEEEPGQEERTCNRCGKKETEEIPAIVHVHNMICVGSSEPTCEREGNNVYWKCTTCGKYYADSIGETEIEQGSWVVPALGHKYGEPTYEWSEDNTSVTAKTVCERDKSHVVTETVQTTVTTIAAECEKAGSTTYTAVFTNELFSEQTKTVEISAFGHKYGEPTYEWATDNTSVTATVVCEHDETHVIEETVKTTEAVTTESTCEEAGEKTYTAAFENELFQTQKKTEVMEALGHDWDEGAITTAPTCENAGVKTYTCKRETSHTRTEEIPALGHKYGEPTYEWAEDNSSVTAKAVCEHDKSHVITETVKTTEEVTTEPTCEEAGEKTYTAAFESELFQTQTKTEVIEALGHDWDEGAITTAPTCENAGVKTYTCKREPSHKRTEEISALGHKYGEPTYEWSEDNTSVTAKTICEHDETHVIEETVKTTEAVTTEPTCEEAGEKTYTASFKNGLFQTQTKTEAIEALGHDWSEWIVVKEPTEEEPGQEERTCNRCGKKETREIPALDHVHHMIYTPANAATCEEAGNSAYWTCDKCGRYYADEDGETEIEKDSWIIPALGHKYGEPTYEWAEDNSIVTAKAVCEHDDSHVISETVQTTSETIPPTETEDGSTTYTAVFTNELFTTQIKTVVIPATGPETVKVTGVQLSKTELTLRVGKSETLTATVLPEDAEDKGVTWSSSDPSVAKVDANGKVTAVADTGIADPASVVITVTTNDGKYTASCTVTVEDPVNAFVRRLYLLCFGRKADSGGFNMWTSGLRTRKYTAAFVVQAFFTSNEMKNMKLANEEWVERCYLVMMNRASDAGGKKGWVNKLEIGMSQTYVLRGFVGSTEFNNVCKDYGVERGSVTISEPRDQNQGITEFVGRCYSEVLGRKAEVGGLNDWCKRILTASNRKQAAIDAASNGFFHSPEYMNKHTNNDQYVRTLYRTFLGREADQGGYNNWMKALNSGTSRDDVMKGFANSTEFAKIMAKYGIK
ncbi:MAG: DUF4214 domain-containing protein [Lachnospiraceae bacterium]|nr:DUF4214 domain-containing protein [Lachnospiraceae bacterium]